MTSTAEIAKAGVELIPELRYMTGLNSYKSYDDLIEALRLLEPIAAGTHVIVPYAFERIVYTEHLDGTVTISTKPAYDITKIARLERELAEAKAELQCTRPLEGDEWNAMKAVAAAKVLRVDLAIAKAKAEHAHNTAIEEAARVRIGFQGAFHAGNPIYVEGWNTAVDSYRAAIRALVKP